MTDPVLLTAFRAGRAEHTPEAEDVLLHVADGEATLVADDGETFTFSLRELRAALGGPHDHLAELLRLNDRDYACGRCGHCEECTH